MAGDKEKMTFSYKIAAASDDPGIIAETVLFGGHNTSALYSARID